MFRRASVLLTLLVACVLVSEPLASSFRTATRPSLTTLELTINGDDFRVNGATDFLVFISYMDGLDQGGSNRTTDFNYISGKGIEGIRVFANWWEYNMDGDDRPDGIASADNDGLCESNGTLRASTLTTLEGLLDDAKAYGLIVDLTFAAEIESGLTLAEYEDCLQNITQHLENGGADYEHVFFDIQNEYNLNGPNNADPLSDGQVAALVTAIKAIDPTRIVTASISSVVSNLTTVKNKTAAAGVDVLGYHHDRTKGYYDLSGGWTNTLDGSSKPVYMQEPERRRTDTNSIHGEPEDWLTKERLATDLYNVYSNGGAAWTFHNGGSFLLGHDILQGQLDPTEELFLTCLDQGDPFSNTCSPGPVPDMESPNLLFALLNWLAPNYAPRVGGTR